MMKKIIAIISDYANAVLIFLTILVFLLLINFINTSYLVSAKRIIQIQKVYADAFYFNEQHHLIINPEAIEYLFELFPTSYSGQSGTQLSVLLKELEESMERLRYQEDYIEPFEQLQLKEQLNRVILLYEEILDKREYVFNILLYLLLISICLQFIFLISTINTIITKERINSENRRFINDFQDVIENERRGIASFLHDQVLQDLGSLMIQPDISGNPLIRGQMELTISRLRNMTYSITPLNLSQIGLQDSLRDLTDSLFENSDITVKFTVTGLLDHLLDERSSLVLYRVFQESLNNICKHAEAKEVDISVVASNPYIIVIVRDNGKGMDYDRVSHSREKKLGLPLMIQQIESIGGSVDINSNIGEGTSILMKIPYGVSSDE